MSQPVDLPTANFEPEGLRSDVPVLMDVWASTTRPELVGAHSKHTLERALGLDARTNQAA